MALPSESTNLKVNSDVVFCFFNFRKEDGCLLGENDEAHEGVCGGHTGWRSYSASVAGLPFRHAGGQSGSSVRRTFAYWCARR